jgi:hypothetical protein
MSINILLAGEKDILMMDIKCSPLLIAKIIFSAAEMN